MRFSPLLALLLVVGCSPAAERAANSRPAPTLPSPSLDQDLAPRNAREEAVVAACKGSDRRLGRSGKAAYLRCLTIFSDAGKACTDGSQCLGRSCRGADNDEVADAPVTGRCVADSDPAGCFTYIENGVPGSVCVD